MSVQSSPAPSIYELLSILLTWAPRSLHSFSALPVYLVDSHSVYDCRVMPASSDLHSPMTDQSWDFSIIAYLRFIQVTPPRGPLLVETSFRSGTSLDILTSLLCMSFSLSILLVVLLLVHFALLLLFGAYPHFRDFHTSLCGLLLVWTPLWSIRRYILGTRLRCALEFSVAEISRVSDPLRRIQCLWSNVNGSRWLRYVTYLYFRIYLCQYITHFLISTSSLCTLHVYISLLSLLRMVYCTYLGIRMCLLCSPW